MPDRDDRRGPTPEEDDVARLVKLGGSRPTLAPERLQRMKRQARPAWREAVESRPRPWAVRWLPAVAGLAAASLAALLWIPWRPQVPTPVAVAERLGGRLERVDDRDRSDLVQGAELPAGTTIAAHESPASLRMTGGASVRIDSGSRVALVSSLELRLEAGRVYVDHDGGPGAPGLTVKTPFGAVTEIGTQFEVALADAGVRVRVREGEVLLSRNGRRYSARAGEEVRWRDGRVERAALAPWDPAYDWLQSIAPSPEIDGEALAVFLAWASRETGLEVSWSDPGLASRTRGVALRGSIEGLAPRDALTAVLPAVGLDVTVSDGEIRIGPDR